MGIEATSPKIADATGAKPHSAVEKLTIKEEGKDEIDQVGKETTWFGKMHAAFSEGRIDDAKRVFKEYALDEKDEIKLEENKAFFLYFLFEKGKDNTAISQLEELARSSKTEQTKHNTLTWLSFCFHDSRQTKKEIQLWKNAISEITSEHLITDSIVNLSRALDRDGDIEEAKRILIKRLTLIQEDIQKSKIYAALAIIEKSLGNNNLAVYCKDKSLEYDANNRDELFNSAYSASEQEIEEISISNYLTLLRIDKDNSTALNNLGVRAQEAGLAIKAVENYKESSKLKNSLAMANEGYLLLDAGFTEEAERIAKDASLMDKPHENVYSLLGSIAEKKKEENEKWDRLTKKSFDRQKQIRSYTEQIYLGSIDSLDGEWTLDTGESITLNSSSKIINTTWKEPIGALNPELYKVELTGSISGSTFSGRYKRKKESDGQYAGLLSISNNKDIACLGFVSDEGKILNIISEDQKDDFSLRMNKKSA
ncbi:MAG: hypothetical protein HUN04_22355 [Desulfobacter sp.]|nr:MAG: hypothetical protein HUN04_22355 [Desulfobacter sp.]